MKKNVIKTGIAFRRDTLKALEDYMRSMNLANRSKVIDEAIRLYLSERSILTGHGKIGGAIILYFNHDAEEELTGTQHDFLDIIVSNTHMHIDEENCTEAILVKGDMEKIRDLISKLEKIKDVKAIKYGFFKIYP
jgi:CopG family nickel-responsive transcriptional regulator